MGVRPTILLALLLFPLPCRLPAAASLLPPQEECEELEEDEEPPPITYSGPELGRFRIFFAGKEIGHEDFKISGSANRIEASSLTQLTITREDPAEPPEYLDEEDYEESPPPDRPPAEPVTFRIQSTLRFNDLFEPEDYEVVQEAGPNRMRAKVQFLPDRSRVSYVSDEGVDRKRIELRRDVTVLDDNVFHHYLILSKRYDLCRGGIQEFSAFVPQQFLAGGVSVSEIGKEEVEIEDQPYRLRRFLVDTGELKVNFWLDSDLKLRKLAIPDSEVEVVRE